MNVCRACKKNRLHLFLPLGDHPLANGFLREDQLADAEPKFPLNGYVCLDCGLIQIRNHVPENFFRNYVYLPSTSDVMRRHFSGLAELVAATYLAASDSLAVDIGCNDGLLLKSLKKHGARTLGVDPATNIVEMARAESLEIVNEYFTPAVAVRIRDEYGPAAAILTANTFHHVDDLDSFTEGVALLLDMDGVFIIEVPYAADLVEQNEFDGIYHEHVSQFTVKSIVDLCRRFDLDVFRVVSLPVHGGSMRVFVRQGHGGKTLLPNVDTWLALERDKALLCAATYDSFAQRVQTIRRDLLAMLKQIKAEGKTVAGYGASARGNTLLNTYGIGPELLDYIVDRNHLKQGLYSPGMHIPVHSVEKLVEDQPDYVLIVAWNFAEEILIQQDEYRRRGGRFILPLPKPHILNGD